MNPPPPRLSIVVAARDPGTGLSTYLAALAPQLASKPVECVVAGASRDDIEARAAGLAPRLRAVPAPAGALVPELWTAGIDASAGRVVALTITDCIPSTGWVDAILAADWDAIDAVGGGFDVAAAASSRDRALLYLRYWAFPRCGRPRDVTDLAADNVAYRRSSLMRCAELWAGGFWEPPVHRRMVELGMRLVFNPQMYVTVSHRASVRDMARQRFAHGWRFGSQRLASMGPAERAARIVTSPLIPIVLLARTCRALATQGRLSWRRLAPSVPLLEMYLVIWSLGELAGYIGFRPDRHRGNRRA
jgi:hypothetical protein